MGYELRGRLFCVITYIIKSVVQRGKGETGAEKTRRESTCLLRNGGIKTREAFHPLVQALRDQMPTLPSQASDLCVLGYLTPFDLWECDSLENFSKII